MTRTHTLITLVTALLLCSNAGAFLTLRMDSDTHSEPIAKGNATVPADVHRSTTITLEEQRIVITGTDGTTVYDFATRRRHVIDPKSSTRVEYSLYDTVGFRMLEYRNRIGLARALAAAKLDDVQKPVDHEHVLSFQETPSTPLQVTDDGTDQTFTDGSRVLARTSLKATPVNSAEARMFAQMLRYASGGHPQILAAIAASNAIPERVVLITRQFSLDTTTMTVRAIRQSTEAPLDVSIIPKRTAAADTDPIDRVLDRATSLTPADLTMLRQRALDELAAALKAQRVLDATLGILELNLMTSDPVAPMTPEQRAHVVADPVAARLLGALSARTKEQFTAAVPVLEGLRPATTKPHMLDIFIANDRKSLGQNGGVGELFVRALTVNPAIAGAYKDLGDSLLIGFDAPRAWRSWDEGRRIDPQFANFRAIDQFEKSLASGHPEYF